MTPNPQAKKTINEILDRFSEETADLWEHWMEGDEPDPEEYDKRVDSAYTTATKAITQAMLDALPKKKTDGVKQGTIIPFNSKKEVEMHWLRKTQSAGFNQAIDQMETAIKLRGGEK